MRALLGFLGRHARWALPAGVFLGIAFPRAAALLRPLLAPAVIGTLTAALVRLDWSRMGGVARRPRLPAAMAAWQLVAAPLAVWFGTAAAGLPADLRLLLLLQSAAPPIGSAAVFAMIVGLEGSLAMIGSVAMTLALPLTLTPLVGLLLPGAGVHVDLVAFFWRVCVMVGLPFVIAWIVRRTVGAGRLARNDDVLGGLNVVLLVVFAVGVMDGVGALLDASPARFWQLLALACAATAALHVAAWALFRGAGGTAALSAAILSGNRNMGLMMVVTAGSTGDTFPLYVALAQIPMYFSPLALSPFARRRGAART